MKKFEDPVKGVQVEVFCPKCGNGVTHAPSAASKWGGFAAGAAAGAKLGAGVGLVGGPLVAIAGTIPGAVLGAIFGKSWGAKFGRPKCPKCKSSFSAP